MKQTYRVYRLPCEDGYPMGHEEWSLEPSLEAALVAFPEAPDRDNHKAWEYIQIVSMQSWRKYDCGDDGTQAWRHKGTGYTVPDYCRQSGGCPEIWTHTKRRQLKIAEDAPVWNYIVSYD